MDVKTENNGVKIRISVFDPRKTGVLGRISEQMAKTDLQYRQLYSTLLVTADSIQTVAKSVDMAIAQRYLEGCDGKSYRIGVLSKDENGARWHITTNRNIIGWVDIRELA